MTTSDFKQLTIKLYRLIRTMDPTIETDKELFISKQDYKIIRAFYKTYNMKKLVGFLTFIYIIKQQSINYNMIPTQVTEIICKKLGTINANKQ